MNRSASFAGLAVLSLLALSAHAGTIAPGVNLGLSNGTSNLTFLNTAPGTFTASDAFHTVTVVYTDVPNVVDAFAVTDVCLTLGSLKPCPAYTLTIADANAAGLAVGVGLSTSAQANTTLASQLSTIKLDGSLGLTAETIDFALPSSSTPGNTSPVPEPGTLSLLGTGVLSAAAMLRRKMGA